MSFAVDNATPEELRTERAQRAVKAFRAMQPGLTGYVRAITGDARIVLEISTGVPRTDGRKIYFRPPIELGDLTPHDRGKCDRRDPETLKQLCDACRIREEVLITIYHEIAHIIYGTLAEPSSADKIAAMERAIEEAPSKLADTIRKSWDSVPSYKKSDYLNLSSLISPFLPTLVNALEDARVDDSMFRARRGTKVMFDAMVKSVFMNGFEANGEINHWNEKPLNSQILIGIFVLACKYDYRGWFHEDVERALGDKKLRQLVDRVETLRSSAGSYNLAFPILARLRELGFCRNPEEENEEPEDQPELDEPDPEEEPQDEQDSGYQSGDPGEGDESGDGDDGDPRNGEVGEDDSSDPSESGGGDGDPDESGTDSEDQEGDPESGSASPEQPGDADGSDPEDSESKGGGDSEDPESSDEGDAGGESDESASDGGSDPSGEDRGDSADGDGYDSGGEESGDSDAAGPDLGGDSSESGDGGESQGSGEDQSRDSDHSAGDESPEREGEEDHSGSDSSSDGGEGDGTGDRREELPVPDESPRDTDAGDDREDDSSREDAGGSESESVSEPESAGPGEGGEDDLEESEAPEGQEPSQEGEEAEAVDTGADKGEGGTKRPEYGDAFDVEADLQEFSGHDETLADYSDEAKFPSVDNQAIEAAIMQGEYFEKPSIHVEGVREHRHGVPTYYQGREMENGWSYAEYFDSPGVDDSKGYKIRLGIDCDMDVPESVLSPALGQMRRAFSDNERAAYERHLRSGRVNQRVLGKRAWAGDDRLFQKKRIPGKRSYAVILGIDISGSTVGRNIALAKRAAMAQAELCQRMGIDFAIYAHTALRPKSQSMEYALDMHVIKEFSQPWNDKSKTALSKISATMENLDGHGVEYYRKVIERHSATDKIILYYTDGKMPAANYEEELEILQREILTCKKKSITLLGVGIRTDSPTRHGLDTVQVDDDSDMVKVIRHLQSALLHRR